MDISYSHDAQDALLKKDKIRNWIKIINTDEEAIYICESSIDKIYNLKDFISIYLKNSGMEVTNMPIEDFLNSLESKVLKITNLAGKEVYIPHHSIKKLKETPGYVVIFTNDYDVEKTHMPIEEIYQSL